MKKLKLLKTISFSSLALLMGIAGTMAFAPLGASPTNVAGASEAVETTTEQGLITTKADDPVIYTTESGLEIKFGNIAPETSGSSLSSGNLRGFPYFTTDRENTTYTWVISGRNSNVTTLTTAIKEYLFSAWKSNNSSEQSYVYGKDFFDNIYETLSPAGTLIDSIIPAKTFINDYISASLNSIKTHPDIPSGCVLVLSNTVLATGVYNNGIFPVRGNEYYATYHSTEDIVVNMQNYYNNKSFGISSIFSQIKKVSLSTTYGSCWKGVFEVLDPTDHYLFPLAAHSNSTFYYGNYITLSQLSCSSAQFLRGNHLNTYEEKGFNDGYTTVLGANATSLSESRVRSTCGYRPAFVMTLN